MSSASNALRVYGRKIVTCSITTIITCCDPVRGGDE